MIGCFGKLPAAADFVSLHGAAEEVREFDAWLQAGLGRLQGVEDWRERFDRLPLCHFCFRARSGNWLFGGLASSRDASGRRYPFLVFQGIRGGHAQGFVAPHTLGELFAGQVTPLLNQARQGVEAQQLFARIEALRPWGEQDLALYRRVHEKFLADFNLRDIAAALANTYPEFVASALLHRLHALRAPLAEGRALVLRLPLPAERWLKRPVADLWCTWLARFAGGAIPVASLLVDDFMRPELLCFTGRGEDALYRLLTGVAGREERYDLLESFADFNEHHRALELPDEGLALRDYLACFAPAEEAQPV
ncbi:type VI secretion system-associated protein TagF [Pseudomonas sp. 273]|uniref:type VI secretion system-associated protein TagF n=1 Tax=Pseudomonas sp. 273 TaxID=75692 RepID=UPI0023D82C9D|nr:type VI secretion system-associated protein TagF [Pseudomonas sp. 273]